MAQKKAGSGPARPLPTWPSPGNALKHMAISEDLRREIRAGAYKGKIPSLRALAQKYAVNTKTAIKAIHALQAEGLITKKWGMHVSPHRHAAHIGLFLRPSGHLFENFTKTLVGRLQSQGCFPIINDISSPDFQAQAAMYVGQMLKMRPAALVVESGFQEALPAWDRLAKKYGSDTRFIFTYDFDFPQEPRASFVLTDYTHGAYLAAKHLVALGHRRLLLLTFADDHLPPGRRAISQSAKLKAGCEKALAEGGGQLLTCAFPSSLGALANQKKHQGAFKALVKTGRPTALLGASDFLVVSHYPLLGELGLRAPRDIALVGYHNTPWSEAFEVPLTSVSLREGELAEITAGLCLAPNGAPQKIIVTPELVIRSSCGSPRAL